MKVSHVPSVHCMSLLTVNIPGQAHWLGLPKIRDFGNKECLILFLHLSLLKDTVIQSVLPKGMEKKIVIKNFTVCWWTFLLV